MTYGNSLSSLSLASSHSGGISVYCLAHGSGGHVRVNRLKPRAAVYACTEHARSLLMCPSSNLWRLLFMGDSGCSL